MAYACIGFGSATLVSGVQTLAELGGTLSHGVGTPQVEWTQELHDRFVCAVETLGADKAVPSKILDHMGPIAAGLTRQNVASHLQKYRKRHSAQSDFCKAAAYCPPAAYPCWSPFATPYMMGTPTTCHPRQQLPF